MTKTLTEQYRDLELPDGKYYIKLEPNFAERYDVGYSECGAFTLYNFEDIEEVLAPVPSYDEWQAELDSNNELLNVQKRLEKRLVSNSDESVQKMHILEKRLEIATKALELYAETDWWKEARKALKEMEGVK